MAELVAPPNPAAENRSAHVTLLAVGGAHEDAEHEGLHPALTCLISQHEEVELVEQLYGEHAWQTEVVHFLHSIKIQICSMVLLMLDIVIIIVELYLDMEFPACHIITRDATSCCAPSWYNSSIDDPGRRLAGYDLCGDGLVAVPENRAGCDYHQHAEVHVAHDVLLWLSVAILSLFGLELFLLFCIERLIFLRNPLYVLDAFVIAAALAIELYIFYAGSSQELSTVTGLLILSRSWRFVRVGHAIYMVNKKNDETHVLSDPLTPSHKSHKLDHAHRGASGASGVSGGHHGLHTTASSKRRASGAVPIVTEHAVSSGSSGAASASSATPRTLAAAHELLESSSTVPWASSAAAVPSATSSLKLIMCPIRDTLVCRYRRFSGLGAVCDGTRSTMRRPYPVSPENFLGLLDMRRMSLIPRSAKIWAPVPYSRESIGKPSSVLASIVSSPRSWAGGGTWAAGGTWAVGSV